MFTRVDRRFQQMVDSVAFALMRQGVKKTTISHSTICLMIAFLLMCAVAQNMDLLVRVACVFADFGWLLVLYRRMDFGETGFERRRYFYKYCWLKPLGWLFLSSSLVRGEWFLVGHWISYLVLLYLENTPDEPPRRDVREMNGIGQQCVSFH